MIEILQAFRSKEIFTFSEAYALYKGSKASLSRLIYKYTVQEKLKKIRNELYYIIPAGEKSSTPDPYKIASHIVQPYYLAYHTAMELHGVGYTAINTKYVAALSSVKPFSYNTFQFICVKPLNDNVKLGAEELVVSNCKIKLSNRERTIIDCLDRLNYAGGLEEAIKSLRNFPSVDKKKLVLYLSKLNRKILYAKVGWFLELLREQWNIDENILNRLSDKVSGRAMYLDSTQKEVFHISKWNLLVPRNINNILSGV